MEKITTRDIRISFYELERILEKLNTSYYKINEKYGKDEAKLFEAGFWDRLKSGAGKIGSAIGGVAGSIKNTATDAITGVKKFRSDVATGVKDLATDIKTGVKTAYDKGKELGQQALTAINDIANRVGGYFSQAFEWISKQPEAFWNKIKEGWNTVADQISKMKETAGDKFQLNVGLILEDINKKLCRKLRELMNDKQMSDYAIARKRPSEFFGKYAKFKGTLQAVAKELIKSEYKNAKEFGQKLLNTMEQGAIDVGLFLIGIIIAPFYLVGWATKKLMVLGIDFAKVVDDFIKTAKTELPEVWSEFKTGVKTSYEDTTKPTGESRILRFDDFVNERNKKE